MLVKFVLFLGIGAVLANDCESRCFHDVIWSAIEYANEASADTWL